MDYLKYGKQEPQERIFGEQKSSGLEKETLKIKCYEKPFPHLIVENFYDKKELELIWEELKFYTKPNKLLTAKDYKGVVGSTNAHALELDVIYSKQLPNDKVNYRNISNILTVNRKLFTSEILKKYSEIHDCCTLSLKCTHDFTKVRYYHDGEYYKPHVDAMFNTLAFSYFYKEPKLFSGGELYFPKYNYEYSCNNNTMIIFPSWVEHGVREVKIKNSDYFDGFGRYAITSFLATREQ